MRISDWSSDVCSSDLGAGQAHHVPVAPEDDLFTRHETDAHLGKAARQQFRSPVFGHEHAAAHPGSVGTTTAEAIFATSLITAVDLNGFAAWPEHPGQDRPLALAEDRSEVDTSELQSLMRISYDVF